MDIEFADVDRLAEACEGSWYFIAGAGGDPQEWVSGYEDLMERQDIGKPMKWYRTNGASVNSFALSDRASEVAERDRFPGDLTCLLFPLDGLNIGQLAIFKVGMQDRWFDDVIGNMRRHPDE